MSGLALRIWSGLSSGVRWDFRIEELGGASPIPETQVRARRPREPGAPPEGWWSIYFCFDGEVLSARARRRNENRCSTAHAEGVAVVAGKRHESTQNLNIGKGYKPVHAGGGLKRGVFIDWNLLVLEML
jgi:hypothetical protein